MYGETTGKKKNNIENCLFDTMWIMRRCETNVASVNMRGPGIRICFFIQFWAQRFYGNLGRKNDGNMTTLRIYIYRGVLCIRPMFLYKMFLGRDEGAMGRKEDLWRFISVFELVFPNETGEYGKLGFI